MNQHISRQRGIAQLLGSKNIHNIISLKKEIQLALHLQIDFKLLFATNC